MSSIFKEKLFSVLEKKFEYVLSELFEKLSSQKPNESLKAIEIILKYAIPQKPEIDEELDDEETNLKKAALRKKIIETLSDESLPKETRENISKNFVELFSK